MRKKVIKRKTSAAAAAAAHLTFTGSRFCPVEKERKRERNKIAEQRAAERVESGGDGTSKSDDWKM